MVLTVKFPWKLPLIGSELCASLIISTCVIVWSGLYCSLAHFYLFKCNKKSPNTKFPILFLAGWVSFQWSIFNRFSQHVCLFLFEKSEGLILFNATISSFPQVPARIRDMLPALVEMLFRKWAARPQYFKGYALEDVVLFKRSMFKKSMLKCWRSSCWVNCVSW